MSTFDNSDVPNDHKWLLLQDAVELISEQPEHIQIGDVDSVMTSLQDWKERHTLDHEASHGMPEVIVRNLEEIDVLQNAVAVVEARVNGGEFADRSHRKLMQSMVGSEGSGNYSDQVLVRQERTSSGIGTVLLLSRLMAVSLTLQPGFDMFEQVQHVRLEQWLRELLQLKLLDEDMLDRIKRVEILIEHIENSTTLSNEDKEYILNTLRGSLDARSLDITKPQEILEFVVQLERNTNDAQDQYRNLSDSIAHESMFQVFREYDVKVEYQSPLTHYLDENGIQLERTISIPQEILDSEYEHLSKEVDLVRGVFIPDEKAYDSALELYYRFGGFGESGLEGRFHTSRDNLLEYIDTLSPFDKTRADELRERIKQIDYEYVSCIASIKTLDQYNAWAQDHDAAPGYEHMAAEVTRAEDVLGILIHRAVNGKEKDRWQKVRKNHAYEVFWAIYGPQRGFYQEALKDNLEYQSLKEAFSEENLRKRIAEFTKNNPDIRFSKNEREVASVLKSEVFFGDVPDALHVLVTVLGYIYESGGKIDLGSDKGYERLTYGIIRKGKTPGAQHTPSETGKVRTFSDEKQIVNSRINTKYTPLDELASGEIRKRGQFDALLLLMSHHKFIEENPGIIELLMRGLPSVDLYAHVDAQEAGRRRRVKGSGRFLEAQMKLTEWLILYKSYRDIGEQFPPLKGYGPIISLTTHSRMQKTAERFGYDLKQIPVSVNQFLTTLRGVATGNDQDVKRFAWMNDFTL